MGITGLKQPLLEYLKKKQYSHSIDSLRNLVLGVDSSIWLNLSILGSDNIKDVASFSGIVAKCAEVYI